MYNFHVSLIFLPILKKTEQGPINYIFSISLLSKTIYKLNNNQILTRSATGRVQTIYNHRDGFVDKGDIEGPTFIKQQINQPPPPSTTKEKI